MDKKEDILKLMQQALDKLDKYQSQGGKFFIHTTRERWSEAMRKAAFKYEFHTMDIVFYWSMN